MGARPHSRADLGPRRDEIVREWVDVAAEAGDYKAIEGLALAFAALEGQNQRLEEQYAELRDAVSDVLKPTPFGVRLPNAAMRRLRKVLDG